MTYREAFFKYKDSNKYLTNNVIKSLLMDDGGFTDYFALLKNFDDTVKDENLLEERIKRISAGEPFQYVLGYAYFVNGNYFVTPDVLIPRQETEQLAVATYSLIMKTFGKDSNITIVDVGTGSGILAIYLKEHFKNAKVIAVDISEKSLEIARKNAKKHQVSIDFRLGNLLEPIKETVDVIISNPPYILNEQTVSPETLKYEPHLALFGNYYDELIAGINFCSDNYILAFEIGEDMEEMLTNLIETKYPGIAYTFEKDMYGKTRFLFIIRNEEIKKYDNEGRA